MDFQSVMFHHFLDGLEVHPTANYRDYVRTNLKEKCPGVNSQEQAASLLKLTNYFSRTLTAAESSSVAGSVGFCSITTMWLRVRSSM